MSEQTFRSMPANGASETTLRDVLAPLFRRRRLVAASFCGILLGAIVAAFILSHMYEARMEILVDRERMDPAVTAEQFSQTAPAAATVTEEEINSEVQLLQSSDLLEKVVIANGLQNIEKRSFLSMLMPKQDENYYVSKAAVRLGKKLYIEAMTKTNLIEVTYKSTDPKLAFGVMNALSNLYLEKHVSVHRPTGSFDLFSIEVEKYRQALQDSETRLANFGRDEGVAAPDVVRGDLGQQVANSIASFHQAQQATAADEQRIRDEEAQLKTTPARSATTQASNAADVLLQGLQASLLASQLKRTQLAMKYDESYPLVLEADQEIAQTKAMITEAQKTQYVNQTTDRDPTYEFLREDVSKTQADLAAQKATAAALGNSIQSLKLQMVDLDQKAVKQTGLIRDAKANEANYLLYLSKREQERTSDFLDQKRIANVAIAVPPSMPELPAYSPFLIMLIGLVLAVGVSVGAAFVAEYLDPSFRTPAEVMDILKMPVLASMPKKVA
jgi:uncharacterized protein involved in exopolysaccharide biosynthesis